MDNFLKVCRRQSRQVARCERAADWLLRLEHDKLSKHQMDQWLAWMQSDAAHGKTFRDMDLLASELRQIDDMPLPDVEAIASDDYDGTVSVDAYKKHRGRKGRHQSSGRSESNRFWQWYFKPVWIAAGLCLIAVLLYPVVPELNKFLGTASQQQTVYHTKTAEHSDVQLPDGSQIKIGAKSIVELDYRDKERQLNLVQGEAIFTVAKDSDRPFVVNVGKTRVVAIGTAFNVNRHRSDTVVTVLEGRTRVSASLDDFVELEAGQSVIVHNYVDKGRISAIEQLGASHVAPVEWQRGVLHFIEQPLHRVVEDVNRYSEQRVVLAEPAIGELIFSGTMVRGHEKEWLTAVVQAFPVTVLKQDDVEVVLSGSYDSSGNKQR